jgi:hypothetical protein
VWQPLSEGPHKGCDPDGRERPNEFLGKLKANLGSWAATSLAREPVLKDLDNLYISEVEWKFLQSSGIALIQARAGGSGDAIFLCRGFGSARFKGFQRHNGIDAFDSIISKKKVLNR